MLETTAENSMVIEKYFSEYIKTRSQFRIGKVFSTVTDPENFLSYMKDTDGIEDDKTSSKWDQLNLDTKQNKQ